MPDIAPLGFAVDTKALADAAAVAKDAAVQISGVADAADKVGDATGKSVDSVKKSTDAHKEHAKAVQETAKAYDDLATKKRIHDMVERSLAQNQPASIMQGGFVGGTVQRNPGAAAFAHQMGVDAYKHMGPTDADIARQAKATKEAEGFRKELERIAAVADPMTAKLMKLDAVTASLGKAFDAGKLSPDQYNRMLGGLDQQYNQLENGPGPNRHRSFLGEFGRSLTYGIPRFGREARRLVYEGEDDLKGGGGGIGDLAKLAGGAAIGMVSVEAFRMIMALPGKIAEAVDQTEKLHRQFDTLGDSQGMNRVEAMANNISMGFKAAADGVLAFRNEFTRLSMSTDQQDRLFAAASAAGRVGGLDDQARSQSAISFAQMAQQPVVSASALQSLKAQNPTLFGQLAQGMGVGGDTMMTMASSNQLGGKALADALQREYDRIMQLNQRLPETAKELEQKAKDTSDQLDADMGDHVIGMFYRLSAKINTGLDHLFGGGDSTVPLGTASRGSQTVALPEARTSDISNLLSRAGAVGQGYGGYQEQQAKTQADLQLVNDAIAQGTKHWNELTDAQRKGVDSLKDYRREIQSALADPDTPFKHILDQVDDLTAAIGHGGSSSLIGVWQQALEIQREQERLGHGVAGSLGEIVQQLLAIKRAQQEIADSDELKKLQDSIDTTTAKRGALGLGSYEEQVRAHDIEMGSFARQHEETFNGAGGGTVTTSAGTMSLSAFLAQIKLQESGSAGDRTRPSSAGAMFGMQVLPSTAFHPGYGVRAASGMNASEFDRVGTDLATHWYNYYGGDVGKAAAAYHSGLGNVNRLGPEGRAYVQKMLTAAGAGGVAAGGTNLLSPLLSKKDAEFYGGLDLSSASSLASLIGNPDAFMATGAVSGGSVAGLSSQAAALRGGGTPADQHRAELEAKIAESVKSLAPAYRDAYAAAQRLEDAGHIRLQSEERVAQLQQGAKDNERRAIFAAMGDPATMKSLELQLKIEEIRRQPGSADDQERQVAAATADARGQSALAQGNIVGGLKSQNTDLRDQLSLVKFTTDQLALQQKIMEAKKQIEDQAVPGMEAETAANEATAEALIIQNEQLSKKLDFIDTLEGSFNKATAGIADGWTAMFARMERNGGLHVKMLIRATEEAFYGMLDDLEKKLVISPLMNILDQLFSKLTGSLFGGGGGAEVPGFNDASMFLNSANGNVFRSMALGGTGVFNTPTRFALGGGGTGLAGEGPGLYEAIMPLQRRSDGKLGVAGGGGGQSNTTVNIIDQRGSDAPAVEVQQRENGNGMRQIDVTIREAQRGNIASGKVDADMRGAYGINRPAVRR